MRPLTPLIISLVFSLFAGANAQESKPLVHPLFSDHMVLQRGKQVPVWGWAKPGSNVAVTFGSMTASATADSSGKWVAKIGPFEANPRGSSLMVKGDETKQFKDVLVGDVWICSGQSNMEWPVAASNDAQNEIANGSHPSVRLFTVPKLIETSPQELVDGTWTTCTPQSIPQFSAVGYFFGRELNQKLDVPIGLIHTSWGGTIAEAWTSAEALTEEMDDFDTAITDLQQMAKEVAAGDYNHEEKVSKWWATNDEGSKGTASWAKVDVDHRDWKTMSLPINWEEANVGLDSFDGIVWFRKEFDIPASWAGKDVVLDLGPIDDADTTWVNGHEVGSMSNWNSARKYTVKAAHLKTGKNVIAIRVFDGNGGGGIYGQGHNMVAQLANDKTKTVSIGGDWRFKATAEASKLPPFPQAFGQNPNRVTVLYNGMLAPLKPFGITGAIWYQGESNAGRPTQYRTLLPTMINDWRNQFEQGDFPFLVVQLANFMTPQATPIESGWAELREAQQMTAQRDKNVGLAVITDIGEANDIHPRNKQDVGKRLALQALTIQYGKDVVHSGPTLKDMGVKGDAVVLDFANVGGGLVAKGGKLKGFAIAEKEGDFVWAEGKIEGNSIELWNEDLAEPIRVRYNWANNPIGNLFNQEGLPAAPFRTDRR